VHVEDGMCEPSAGQKQRSGSTRASGAGYAERAERGKPAEFPVDGAARFPAGARGGVDRSRDHQPGACVRETRGPPTTSQPRDRRCGRQESDGRSNDVARSDARSGSVTRRHADAEYDTRGRGAPASAEGRARGGRAHDIASASPCNQRSNRDENGGFTTPSELYGDLFGPIPLGRSPDGRSACG
jgi:hypothetical protein